MVRKKGFSKGKPYTSRDSDEQVRSQVSEHLVQTGWRTSDEESWMKLQVLIQAAGDLNTIKILINGEKSCNITEKKRWQLI